MRIGPKLKMLRDRAGLTQRDVLDRTGIGQSKLSNIETETVPPKSKNPPELDRHEILELARLYGVSVEFLCDDDLESDPGSPASKAPQGRVTTLDPAVEALAARAVEKTGVGPVIDRLAALIASAPETGTPGSTAVIPPPGPHAG